MTQHTRAERIATFEALVERLNENPVDADILQAARDVSARASQVELDLGEAACETAFGSDIVLSRFNEKALAKGGSGQLNSAKTACNIVKRAQEISR